MQRLERTMTTNNTAATLNGKTANEIREMIAARTVTAKAVVAYLEGKASLRAPSAKLLAELKGEAPAKAEPKAKVEAPAPAKAKVEPKVETVVTITAAEFAELVARVTALEAKVLAKAEPKAKKAKAEAKAEPVAEPVVEPVKPTAKAQTPVESVELPAYSEAKLALEGLSVKALRAHAKELGITATAKADIVDAMMAQALAEGEVFDDREADDGAEELASAMFDMIKDEIEGEVF